MNTVFITKEDALGLELTSPSSSSKDIPLIVLYDLCMFVPLLDEALEEKKALCEVATDYRISGGDLS